MTDTSVIEASSVGIKTMADGTLRLTIDVEPRNAQAAFKLFGSPGTPMAVAALKPGAATEAPSPEPLKGGEIAKWLGMRCADADFQTWLYVQNKALFQSMYLRNGIQDSKTEEIASAVVRDLCEVKSRAEIDNDPAARERFERLIRKPWLERQK